MAAKCQKAKIISEGMGGFLNPPSHPEHFFSVKDRGYFSLSYYLNTIHCDCLIVKREIEGLLKEWEQNKPSISSIETQIWIKKVLGYYRNCYVRPYCGNDCDKLFISKTLNPLANAHIHRGVCFIREFYPEFVPNSLHFEQASWGG